MKPSAQLIIALLIIGYFGVAYLIDPADETMKGALIAAFAGAWGFFLGSSSGSKANGDIIRQIAKQPTVTATGDQPTITATSASVTATDQPEETSWPPK